MRNIILWKRFTYSTKYVIPLKKYYLLKYFHRFDLFQFSAYIFSLLNFSRINVVYKCCLCANIIIFIFPGLWFLWIDFLVSTFGERKNQGKFPLRGEQLFRLVKAVQDVGKSLKNTVLTLPDGNLRKAVNESHKKFLLGQKVFKRWNVIFSKSFKFSLYS